MPLNKNKNNQRTIMKCCSNLTLQNFLFKINITHLKDEKNLINKHYSFQSITTNITAFNQLFIAKYLVHFNLQMKNLAINTIQIIHLIYELVLKTSHQAYLLPKILKGLLDQTKKISELPCFVCNCIGHCRLTTKIGYNLILSRPVINFAMFLSFLKDYFIFFYHFQFLYV